jgi:CHAT domain-containing protein
VFTEKAAGYPVIHLATHASISADSNINWIQFYPSDPQDINNKLYVQEIYNLDLHKTELVILSACQTAGGAAVTGEGLLSLSRAFIYAGADGIVSTLWKTEDRVTSYLMQRMHIYLKQKMPPENALQQAKKDMLSDKELGAQYKTPNYWANFIYVGKQHSAAAKQQSTRWPAKVLMGVCFIAALVLVWVKRKKLHRYIGRAFVQAKSKFTSQSK